MKREINIADITKDKLMLSTDMARVGSNQCEGCHHCCTNMGNSLVLDPYDIMNLIICLKKDFTSMIGSEIELNVVDGLILPNISMSHELKLEDGTVEKECCRFLDAEGRCSIHEHRPGICRLFPLGRLYENNSFRYFLQSDECVKDNRTKVKIRSFLDIDNLKAYEDYVLKYHYLLMKAEDAVNRLAAKPGMEEAVKQINMYILNTFFITPIGEDNFYEEIVRRIKLAEDKLEGIINALRNEE